jgi:hypothetical protein
MSSRHAKLSDRAARKTIDSNKKTSVPAEHHVPYFDMNQPPWQTHGGGFFYHPTMVTSHAGPMAAPLFIDSPSKRPRSGHGHIKRKNSASIVSNPCFGHVHETPMAVTACSINDTLEEENKKLSSKLELLQKKIRAKDQLFDESLATTFSCNQCGESQSLTAKLKKRVLKQKARIEEAENEIKRLTKTVKVVEVEVRGDTQEYRDQI